MGSKSICENKTSQSSKEGNSPSFNSSLSDLFKESKNRKSKPVNGCEDGLCPCKFVFTISDQSTIGQHRINSQVYDIESMLKSLSSSPIQKNNGNTNGDHRTGQTKEINEPTNQIRVNLFGGGLLFEVPMKSVEDQPPVDLRKQRLPENEAGKNIKSTPVLVSELEKNDMQVEQNDEKAKSSKLPKTKGKQQTEAYVASKTNKNRCPQNKVKANSSNVVKESGAAGNHEFKTNSFNATESKDCASKLTGKKQKETEKGFSNSDIIIDKSLPQNRNDETELSPGLIDDEFIHEILEEVIIRFPLLSPIDSTSTTTSPITEEPKEDVLIDLTLDDSNEMWNCESENHSSNDNGCIEPDQLQNMDANPIISSTQEVLLGNQQSTNDFQGQEGIQGFVGWKFHKLGPYSHLMNLSEITIKSPAICEDPYDFFSPNPLDLRCDKPFVETEELNTDETTNLNDNDEKKTNEERPNDSFVEKQQPSQSHTEDISEMNNMPDALSNTQESGDDCSNNVGSGLTIEQPEV